MTLVITLAIESLAEIIRNDPNVAGFSIGDKEHKVALCTDDMVLYVTNPTASLKRITQTMEEFGNLVYL